MYSKDIYLVIPSDFFTMAVFLNQTFRVSTQSFLCFFWIRPSVFRPSPSYIFFESDLPCFDPILLMLFFLIRPPVFRPSPSWFFSFFLLWVVLSVFWLSHLISLRRTFSILTQSFPFMESVLPFFELVFPSFSILLIFWLRLTML